jgi:hypothetical protein
MDRRQISRILSTVGRRAGIGSPDQDGMGTRVGERSATTSPNPFTGSAFAAGQHTQMLNAIAEELRAGVIRYIPRE